MIAKWVIGHKKLIACVVGLAATAVQSQIPAGGPWVTAGLAVLTALGVYQVRNGPRPPQS